MYSHSPGKQAIPGRLNRRTTAARVTTAFILPDTRERMSERQKSDERDLSQEMKHYMYWGDMYSMLVYARKDYFHVQAEARGLNDLRL